MSDRCVRCGKPAAVRRVLPPNDPLGVAGGPLPVCMECAQAIDSGADLSAAAPVTAMGTARSGGGYLLLAVFGLIFLVALVFFIQANGG